LTEQEAKKKAMEILKPVEARLYAAEWRNLMLAIQDELVKASKIELKTSELPRWKPISRTEALEISKEALLAAEQERIDVQAAPCPECGENINEHYENGANFCPCGVHGKDKDNDS
jgi:hypothetical protein